MVMPTAHDPTDTSPSLDSRSRMEGPRPWWVWLEPELRPLPPIFRWQ